MAENDKDGANSMVDDAAQRALDAEEHRKTYERIMKASGEVGVPFTLALAVFFTFLVMAKGFIVAVIAGVFAYVFVFFVVRTFFSH